MYIPNLTIPYYQMEEESTVLLNPNWVYGLY